MRTLAFIVFLSASAGGAAEAAEGYIKSAVIRSYETLPESLHSTVKRVLRPPPGERFFILDLEWAAETRPGERSFVVELARLEVRDSGGALREVRCGVNAAGIPSFQLMLPKRYAAYTTSPGRCRLLITAPASEKSFRLSISGKSLTVEVRPGGATFAAEDVARFKLVGSRVVQQSKVGLVLVDNHNQPKPIPENKRVAHALRAPGRRLLEVELEIKPKKPFDAFIAGGPSVSRSFRVFSKAFSLAKKGAGVVLCAATERELRRPQEMSRELYPDRSGAFQEVKVKLYFILGEESGAFDLRFLHQTIAAVELPESGKGEGR